MSTLEKALAPEVNRKMLGSLIIKRAIVIGNSKTCVSLEEPFWDALGEIARGQNLTRSQLASKIAQGEGGGGLSSAIRVFVLRHFQERRGHEKFSDAS